MKTYTPGNACEVCGAMDTNLLHCELCGGYACENCIVNNKVCLICEEARCYICKDYLSTRACDVCGLPVCEDHGTKIGEATICDNCSANRTGEGDGRK